MSSLKKIFVVFSLIFLSVSVFFVLKTYDNKDEILIQGNIQKIEGNILSVYGKYVSDTSGDFRLIEVKIDEDVMIEKVSFSLSTNNENVKIEDLPKEIRRVDASTLRRDFQNVPISADILLRTSFLLPGVDKTAQIIRYRAQKY
jgi:hypothetical protein